MGRPEANIVTETFHEGERRVQQRAGAVQGADRNAPMIASTIPAGAIPFLQQQSLLVLAILDHGAMWCLPAVGAAGWLSATRNALSLDLEKARAPLDERILSAAAERQSVGGVVLDFATRRRLRVNGRLERTSDRFMVLNVAEAYPNCPKYITQRTVVWSGDSAQTPLQQGHSLTGDQRDALSRTDVFFLASRHPDGGLDASHRGGNPGFVESPTATTLRFRDFPGNDLFNTLGNLEIDARVGVLLPDFSNGRALAITGTAATRYEDQGQTRWTTITIQQWTELNFLAKEIRRQLSPFNP